MRGIVVLMSLGVVNVVMAASPLIQVMPLQQAAPYLDAEYVRRGVALGLAECDSRMALQSTAFGGMDPVWHSSAGTLFSSKRMQKEPFGLGDGVTVVEVRAMLIPEGVPQFSFVFADGASAAIKSIDARYSTTISKAVEQKQLSVWFSVSEDGKVLTCHRRLGPG